MLSYIFASNCLHSTFFAIPTQNFTQQLSSSAQSQSDQSQNDIVQGWTALGIALGVVRGAEHRRIRRKRPAGARARCARVGCQHRDVLSDDPAEAEKRREF